MPKIGVGCKGLEMKLMPLLKILILTKTSGREKLKSYNIYLIILCVITILLLFFCFDWKPFCYFDALIPVEGVPCTVNVATSLMILIRCFGFNTKMLYCMVLIHNRF